LKGVPLKNNRRCKNLPDNFKKREKKPASISEPKTRRNTICPGRRKKVKNMWGRRRCKAKPRQNGPQGDNEKSKILREGFSKTPRQKKGQLVETSKVYLSWVEGRVRRGYRTWDCTLKKGVGSSQGVSQESKKKLWGGRAYRSPKKGNEVPGGTKRGRPGESSEKKKS